MSSPVVPPGRRPAIDVARVGALAVVVAGHLIMAVVDRGPDGAVRGVNLFELEQAWRWLTLLSPMPVLFAVGGWANASSSPASAARRLRPLVGLATVVVAVWYLPAVVELARSGERGVLGDGARLATQPVWFLAAYLPFAVAGRRLAGVARRPVWSIGACLVVLAVADLARFRYGASELIGWLGFLPAWAVPWLLGAWWRRVADEQQVASRPEAVRGAAIAGVCLVVGLVLVGRAGYSPTLIDVVDGDRSNTTPPTLFTAVVAAGHVGLLMVAARVLDRLGVRRRAAVDRASTFSVPVYLWHLTALALCSGAVALGLSVPERMTVGWWLGRPLWWASVLAVTAGLVALSAAGREALVRWRPRPDGTSPGGVAAVVVGTVLAAAGAALVGVRGPTSVVLAVSTVTLLTVGWRLLRA